MRDLIERQAAIDDFYKYPNVKWTTLDVLEHINALPSARHEQRWIPCSERLPEKAYGQYWVCTDTGYQCQCRWTDNVYGLGSSGEWAWKIFDIPQYSHVVAWMPLPEPYREKERRMTDTERNRIQAICEVAGVPEIDDLSDGFHTFRQLYYQRMILFATIVKQNKDRAWKSLRHEDGELCFGGGWFIVGIDTPEGSYTYHYEDNYFGLFDCKELERAKHWDGHTEKDVTRLLSLPSAQPETEERTAESAQNVSDSELISRKAVIDALDKHFEERLRLFGYDSYEKADDKTRLVCDGIANAIDVVDNLPPAQQWIPVTERLPKVGQTVICQCRADILKLLKLDSGDDWYQDAEHAYMNGFVVAWMPLPEPYKERWEE